MQTPAALRLKQPDEGSEPPEGRITPSQSEGERAQKEAEVRQFLVPSGTDRHLTPAQRAQIKMETWARLEENKKRTMAVIERLHRSAKRYLDIVKDDTALSLPVKSKKQRKNKKNSFHNDPQDKKARFVVRPVEGYSNLDLSEPIDLTDPIAVIVHTVATRRALTRKDTRSTAERTGYVAAPFESIGKLNKKHNDIRMDRLERAQRELPKSPTATSVHLPEAAAAAVPAIRSSINDDAIGLKQLDVGNASDSGIESDGDSSAMTDNLFEASATDVDSKTSFTDNDFLVSEPDVDATDKQSESPSPSVRYPDTSQMRMTGLGLQQAGVMRDDFGKVGRLQERDVHSAKAAKPDVPLSPTSAADERAEFYAEVDAIAKLDAQVVEIVARAEKARERRRKRDNANMLNEAGRIVGM